MSDHTNAFDALERVNDMESFFEFVRALIQDRVDAVAAERERPTSALGPDTGGWENVSIEQYLEAALAWAESTSMGARQGIEEPMSWRGFATFLYLGKIYE